MHRNEHDREQADSLPFLANGTLDPAEAKALQDGLARDAALRVELALVRDEQQATIAVNERLSVPTGRAARGLIAAIEREPAARQTRRLGDVMRRIGWSLAALPPRALGWTAAAAGLVLAVQLGAVGSMMMADAPTYARIGFAPKATAEEIAALLERHGATIVAGPKDGVFKVRLADRRLRTAELDRILTEMGRKVEIVRFAAPGRK